MCYKTEQGAWEFHTRNFTVSLTLKEDWEIDHDEDQEVIDAINSGKYSRFGAIVTVFYRDKEIAQDSLWGCIYENPSEFWTAHRDSNPLHRNSSIMRAANGDNMSICHYFPGMVSEAVKSARKAMQSYREVKLRA